MIISCILIAAAPCLVALHALPDTGPAGLETQAVDAAIDALWDGSDSDAWQEQLPYYAFETQSPMAWRPKSVNAPYLRGVKSGGRKNLILLGPFDSGTNLLLTELKLNFNQSLNCHTIRDGSHCSVWKHGLETDSSLLDMLPTLPEFTPNTTLTMSDFQIIIMVRSPFSQLSSWQKAPYNLNDCLSANRFHFYSSGSLWKGGPCTAAVAWDNSGYQDPDSRVSFHGITDIYNKYLQMYRAIEADGRASVRLVTYEDLVSTPDLVLRSLAEQFGWTQPAEILLLDSPAKDHGKACGRDSALQKISDRSFLDEFTMNDKNAVCMSLDFESIQGLTEGTWGGAPRPYAMDCWSRLPAMGLKQLSSGTS